MSAVALLDGGAAAYPRMLEAIARAKRAVHLQVYAFTTVGVGAEFIVALSAAARRGVSVRVTLDGWGSATTGLRVAATLRAVGCQVRVHNRLLALLVGRIGRNHRKLLVVDQEVAFIGGLNIGDENVEGSTRAAWADLALELRGPICRALAARLQRGRGSVTEPGLGVLLSGPGQGWRLRRAYLRLIGAAQTRIDLAHGYFLPGRRVLRALLAAAKRGVQVRLLLSGLSDVPLARLGTRRLYARLIAAGVVIDEWTSSVLHAKAMTVDSRWLLLGSFNLDPLSLANLEVLVEVHDRPVVREAEAWIRQHAERAKRITALEVGSRTQRWLLNRVGRLGAWLARWSAWLITKAGRRPSRVAPARRNV
jgi:cardiolipin synthase A/B